MYCLRVLEYNKWHFEPGEESYLSFTIIKGAIGFRPHLIYKKTTFARYRWSAYSFEILSLSINTAVSLQWLHGSSVPYKTLFFTKFMGAKRLTYRYEG